MKSKEHLKLFGNGNDKEYFDPIKAHVPKGRLKGVI